MRKMPALALTLLGALALASAAPLILRAQNNGIGAGNPQAVSSPDDMPHRTAREFAPIIRALVTRRYNTIKPMFKIRRSVETYLDQPESVRILGRFQKPDRFDLNLIGGRTLGNNIGTLFFTLATEEGPVAFKINYYGFADEIYISRIEVTDDWDQIETLSASTAMESLPSPITISLAGQIEGGQ